MNGLHKSLLSFSEIFRIIRAMRYMGIDYGSKRIGIAVSDDEGRMAFPSGIIANTGKLAIKKIVARVKKEGIGSIVVGIPVSLDGRETEQTRLTRVFIETFESALTFSVETENEMLTSRMAEHAGIKMGRVDESSAAIILQSYLDKKNRSQ